MRHKLIFHSPQQVSILGATTIESNANFLNFDATSGELAYRKLERSNFNMKGTIFITKRSVLLNGAYPITENQVYAFGVLVIEKVKQQVL
jgi:iron complex outermembrane receptor protein